MLRTNKIVGSNRGEKCINQVATNKHLEINVGSLTGAARLKDSAFIRYFCPQARRGSIVLLIDTGADYSLIKKNSLKADVDIDQNIIKGLRGAFGGYTQSEGVAKLVHSEGSGLEFEMHCVSSKECIPADGILGRDNLWGRSFVITDGKTLKISTGKNEVTFEMKPLDQQYDTESINMVWSDIIANARAVTTVALKVETKEETIIIDKQVLAPGVILGGSATRVIKGRAFAPILNTTEVDFILEEGFKPSFSQFKDFEGPVNGWIANTQEVSKQDRIDKILELIKRDDNWNTEELESVESMCSDFQDVFHLPGDILTCTNTIKHRILVPENQEPIYQRQYRIPHAHREIINKKVEKLETEGRIRKSVSAWNAALLLVPKKNSSDGRLVVDYRKLNDVTIKQIFPIPRMEEILDQLGRSRYFTTLDLESGYHQVEIDERDRELTSFQTAHNKWEWVRLPFGLSGAPMTFQRLMNQVLAGIQGLECFVYLDDIVVYGGNLEEHEARLRNVLQRLRDHNLKLNISKCHILSREVVYLGHTCGQLGVSPDKNNVKCVSTYPRPRNKKQVQSFLGLVNYYRKFIQGCAEMSLPLTKLTRKDSVFDWSTECNEAFEALKTAITSPPVLAYPDFEREFIVTTDASNTCLGAVLSQISNQGDRPIAFASRALNSAETRYSTIEKEFLAIVWAVQNFRAYLLGRHFTIQTDHRPILGINKLRSANSRILKYHFKLAEYDYEIRYKAGKKNQNADCLSRIPAVIDDILLVQTRAMRALDHEQQGSAEAQEAQDEQEDEVTRNHIDNDEGCAHNTIRDDIDDLGSREDAPVTLYHKKDIETVMDSFHNLPLGGHQGPERTIERIRRQYRWKGMNREIEDFIRRCVKCQRYKCSRRTLAPLMLSDTQYKPFDKIHLDMVGPVTETASNNKLILTIQDAFSRFMVAAPMKDGEASTVARTFVTEWISKFGIPKVLVSDNGTNFMSALFTDVCKILGIKKLNTTPYRPESNGMLERAHRPLSDYLRCFVSEDYMNWDQWLPISMFAYNSAINASTKKSPFRVLFGFELETPTNLRRKCTPIYNPDDTSKIMRYQFQRAHELVRENQIKAKEVAKKRYDKKLRPVSFAVGEKVLLRDNARKGKFSPIWLGPYKVTRIISPVTTAIRIKKRSRKYHNNHLRKFYDK